MAVAHKVLRTVYGMIVCGQDYSHAIETNVRRKAAEMRWKARRAFGPANLEAMVPRFTPDVADRISQEVPAA